MQVCSVTITYSFNFDGAQLGLSTDMKLSLLVNICLMIPTKGHVDDVGYICSLELLNLLGRKVGVILRWIDLVSLTPDICVRLDGVEALSILRLDQSLTQRLPVQQWPGR